jgi:hypothetical protein
MVKIISLSGIHNCKKTTTFNELKSFYKNRNDILFISEIPTIIKNIGLGINNDDDFLELLPLRQGLSQMTYINIENYSKGLKGYNYIILDRCSLDVTIYSRYFSDIGDMTNNDDDKFNDTNIDIIKSFYKNHDFKIFYFSIKDWVDNKRDDSMSKESGFELEHNYFNKFMDIMIPYENIDQIKLEVENELIN